MTNPAIAPTRLRSRIPLPGAVVTELTARRAAIQGSMWGLAFGIVVYSSITGFTSAYPTAHDRRLVQSSLAGNAGAQALLGPARHIGTVAGFTAWRALGTIMLVGAIWAILLSTKALRGEEDAGRWEVLLAGPTTRRRAALQAMAGLGTGLLAMFVTTAFVVVLAGQSSDARFGVRASLFFAVALVTSSAFFLAVGALASQLAASRRRAVGLASGVFGVAFVARMVAAVSPGLASLRWLSPLGWIDELHPLTGSQPLLLLPLTLATAASAAAAAHLAGIRDLGASTLPARDQARPRAGLLGGPTELAFRLTRGVATGWILGVGALAFVLGLVAKVAAKSISGSARLRQILEQLGGHRSGAVSYLGFSFVIIATLVALVAAGQVAGTRDEEADGRTEHLLVRPVSRLRWLGGRLAVSVALIAAVAVAAGILAWTGAALQDSGVSFHLMLEAAINVVAPAVVVLGVGTLVNGLRPRLAVSVAYGLVAWSFLMELVGALIKANHWLLDTSVLHHIRPVPAAHAAWDTIAVLVGVAVVTALFGILAFGRRDIATA